jgi:hypothetical protein
MGRLIRAINTVNYPLGSSESLATLSSYNSFSELSESTDAEDVTAKIFRAVESLTMNSYDSTANLSSYWSAEGTSLAQMTFIRLFLQTLEEFSEVSTEGVRNEDSHGQPFMKFC